MRRATNLILIAFLGLLASTTAGCIISSDTPDYSYDSSEDWEGDDSFDDGFDDSTDRSRTDDDPERAVDDDGDGRVDSVPQDCRRMERSYLLPADRGTMKSYDGGCLAIAGDLTIQGNIDSLSVLESFTHLYIGGDLRIVETRGLTDLDGLDGVRFVGGMVDIKANFDLRSLSCMPRLRQVVGDVRITNHPNLESVRGFGMLLQIGGDLRIESNRALTKLDGFPALRYIADYHDPAQRPDPAGETGEPASRRDPDDEVIDPHLIVRDNPNLETIRGFRALTDVDGDIRFIDNPALHAVIGFEQLEFLTGELIVRRSPNLADLSVFDDLPCVAGLRLEETGLTSLEDLSGIHELGEVELRNNPSLNSLEGFEQMVRVRGPVAIRDNDALTDPAELWGIQRIGTRALQLSQNASILEDNHFGADGPDWPTTYREHPNFNCVAGGELDDEVNFGDIRMSGNDALTSLGDLKLQDVGGRLVIRNHDSLESIDGMDSLVRAHAIEIRANDGLQKIRGLSELRRVDGQVAITDNPNLTAVRGFNALNPASVDWNLALGGIIFQNNASLRTIDGFDAIKSLEGALALQDNPNLKTISGFSRLEQVGRFILENSAGGDMDAFARLEDVEGDMAITDNPGLVHADDFQSLRRIDGNFRVERNDELTHLGGFATLRSVDNGVYIQDNPKLPACEAEGLARSLSLAEFAVVEDNGGSC